MVETKNIKDVDIGVYVRSRNEMTKQDIFVEVINKFNNGKKDLVEITLTSGEIVKCTLNHKFRVKENGEMLPLWQIIKEGLSIVVNTVPTNAI